MALPIKNVSTFLSPRLRTSLTPVRNLLASPKSPKNHRTTPVFNVPSVVRRLEFSPRPLSPYQGKIPDFKVDLIPDNDNNLKSAISPNCSKILDLTTPIKKDLVQNGLQSFRKRTTVLGQGSFGVVFKGMHQGQVVAVKLVTKETINQEKNALGLANHRNVINTISIIENPDSQAYNLVIMEYLQNCRSLQDILDAAQTEPIQENMATLSKIFAIDITTGLSYLHDHGIIHLDLKPKNLIVNEENVCKICDFGNSMRIGDSCNKFNYTGTVIYTAPEILLGKTPTTKSDIYSLGLIFWQLKYLKSPFQEYERNESIIYNVGKNGLRPKYQNDGKNGVVDLFTQCWANNPERRPDALQVLKILEQVKF